MDLFKKAKKNLGRQLELDIAKCFAIVLMILVHCFGFCGLCQFEGNLMEYVFLFLQLSAPLFMFSMGVGMVYTRHDTSTDFIKRGIQLFLLGFVINIFYALSGVIGCSEIKYIFLSLLGNDILQFAGLSFIVIGLLKKINMNLAGIALVAVLLSIFGSIVNHVEIENIWVCQLLGHLIGTEGYKIVSCFPICNWLIVPVAGLIFGNALIRCDETKQVSLAFPTFGKDEFYNKIGKICLSLSFIIAVYAVVYRAGMFSSVGGRVFEKLDYIHIVTPDALLMIIMILSVVSVSYWILPFLNDKMKGLIKICSRNVTNIYLIQWFIILLVINPLCMIFGWETSLFSAGVTIVGVIVVSCVLAEVYARFKRLVQILVLKKIYNIYLDLLSFLN